MQKAAKSLASQSHSRAFKPHNETETVRFHTIAIKGTDS